jgi:hypothetical protein
LRGSTVLNVLRISADEISPQDLSVISTFKNLRILWIEKATKVTDKDIAWLAKLHNMQELCPVESQLTAKVAAACRQMPNLRVLALNYKVWTKEELRAFQKAFPKVSVAIDKRIVE